MTETTQPQQMCLQAKQRQHRSFQILNEIHVFPSLLATAEKNANTMLLGPAVRLKTGRKEKNQHHGRGVLRGKLPRTKPFHDFFFAPGRITLDLRPFWVPDAPK
jgi:hypothetical protein